MLCNEETRVGHIHDLIMEASSSPATGNPCPLAPGFEPLTSGRLSHVNCLAEVLPYFDFFFFG